MSMPRFTRANRLSGLGVAPLTSMFLYGENDHRIDNDWRPEIHDTDGLAIWSGNGEWIWRPLTNPANLRFNAYADENPRGFGLLQRDRNFNHYQDDGAYYERRPSVWVEPRSDWGKGSIQLVELPALDETSDNIVAFWNPAKPTQAGQELLFAYRLYWGAKPPVTAPRARVVATRTGQGGVVGQKRKYFSWRFVVDFAGGELPMLGKDTVVEAVITASRGKVELSFRTSIRVHPRIAGNVRSETLRHVNGPDQSSTVFARKRPGFVRDLALSMDTAPSAAAIVISRMRQAIPGGVRQNYSGHEPVF